MGLANYAQTSDVQAYLSSVPNAQQASWPALLSSASRGIDEFVGRHFYNDVSSVKYFDVEGDPSSGTIISSLELPDFYGSTVVKVAQRENGDPAVAADWVTLTGDGLTPPSDFFLEPSYQDYVGKTGDVNLRPYHRIVLPATAPSTSTTFRSSLMPGKKTLSLLPTGWGWPAIPDQIQNITVKVVVRMFKAQPSGFTGAVGSPETGRLVILNFLDMDDISVLTRYRRMSAG